MSRSSPEKQNNLLGLILTIICCGRNWTASSSLAASPALLSSTFYNKENQHVNTAKVTHSFYSSVDKVLGYTETVSVSNSSSPSSCLYYILQDDSWFLMNNPNNGWRSLIIKKPQLFLMLFWDFQFQIRDSHVQSVAPNYHTVDVGFHCRNPRKN